MKMSWLKRKPKQIPGVETALGVFQFDTDSWSTECQTPIGPVLVAMVAETFDPGVIPKVQDLIAELDAWSQRALAHIRSKQPESLTEYGGVTPYVLDVTDLARKESFRISYVFEKWPDGELSVVFENGEPVEIWEDD